jgi:hypothetical protein
MPLSSAITKRIRVFSQPEMHAAIEHAAAGGIAVHLHCFVFPNSPKCFRDAVARGEWIAHVFGQDADELAALARAVGVRRTYIDRPGTPRQHHDLCGTPLKRLLWDVGQVDRFLRKAKEWP